MGIQHTQKLGTTRLKLDHPLHWLFMQTVVMCFFSCESCIFMRALRTNVFNEKEHGTCFQF